MKYLITLSAALLCTLLAGAQDITMITRHDGGEITSAAADNLTKITFENSEAQLTADGDRLLEYNEVDWPDDRLLPRIPAPDKRVYALDMNAAGLSDRERVMFSVLQGIVNRSRARIILYQGDESRNTWPAAHNLRRNVVTVSARTPYTLVDNFKDEIRGLALYSAEHSEHYGNLAATAAGLGRLLPVTAEIRQKLVDAGIDLPVVEDFTGLTMTSPAEVYRYLYDNYWERCNHRLLISLRPTMPYVHDIGAAAGSACVWLDPRKNDEKEVLDLMLQDLTPGRDIVTGWYPEERSGVGEATKFGLSTVPSDFFENASIYSAVRVPVNIPPVPKMPELENKVYATVFISDGDNIQYCQHAMLPNFNQKGRGKIPMNWTISPALVDFSPSMLNYYYSRATENDFFASGPSGLGYAMPYDAHNKRWYTTRGDKFTPYARLSGRYLEKAGLRVVTIWDEVNNVQRSAYARECRYLYGLTIQDWEKQIGRLKTAVADNRLPFIPNYPCYANGIRVITDFFNRDIRHFDGTKPMFVSGQGTVWDMGPDEMAKMEEILEESAPGKVVILRGDHFFNMYNRANGLPFNLTLLPGLKVSSTSSATDASLAADGSPSEGYMWVSSATDGTGSVVCDFGKTFSVSRYVVRHAGAAGLSPALNTRAFTVETSTDGTHWTTAGSHINNTAEVTDADITPAIARYVRITVTDAGADSTARIADIEVYGSEI